MKRIDGRRLLGMVVVAGWCGVTFAQGTVEAPAGGGSIAPPAGGGSIAPPQIMPAPVVPPPTATTQPGTGALPTAESVLKDLLQERSEAATRPAGSAMATPPAGGVETAAVLENGLLPEGHVLYGRTGRLERREGGETVFVFDEAVAGGPAAMRIVPSRRLWALEEAAAGGAKKFRIEIGQVMQYRGNNYLMIKWDDANPPPNPGDTRVPTVEAVAPNAPAAARLGEGQSIYNRVGRLVMDEKAGGMVFVFDADGKQMYDPPMGVIPCRNLMVMEEKTEGGKKGVKLRVSGEVTQYRGKNYLYPKVVQVVRDLNQGLGG